MRFETLSEKNEAKQIKSEEFVLLILEHFKAITQIDYSCSL